MNAESKRLTFYNKLVRDGMPDIISADGHRAAFRALSEAEFRHELKRKLAEEVGEYLESDDVAELADVFAIVRELARIHFPANWPLSHLAGVNTRKVEEKGGFDKRLFLLFVERPEINKETL